MNRKIFPSADLFSEEHPGSIISEFALVLKSHSVLLDLPCQLEINKKYELSIAIIDEVLFISNFSITDWASVLRTPIYVHMVNVVHA